MNAVYLHASFSASLKDPLHPGLRAVPLLRRMTPLQKSVMAALMLALDEHRSFFEADRDAPLYFTSMFGELGAMLRVTQEIEAESLPVSPKDFQHSVLNASLAYLCMQQKSHQPGFAISGGYESADLTLHLAAKRIEAGMDSAAVVIHAHEQTDFENATAELLILSNQREGACYELSVFDRGFPPFDPNPGRFLEGDERLPWLLDDGKPQADRRLRTARGEEFHFVWKELCDATSE